MSDADGRIIPILGEDQGEGMKDPIDDMEDFMKHWGDALKPQENNPILEHFARVERMKEEA